MLEAGEVRRTWRECLMKSPMMILAHMHVATRNAVVVVALVAATAVEVE